jgi:hypothetical protein
VDGPWTGSSSGTTTLTYHTVLRIICEAQTITPTLTRPTTPPEQQHPPSGHHHGKRDCGDGGAQGSGWCAMPQVRRLQGAWPTPPPGDRPGARLESALGALRRCNAPSKLQCPKCVEQGLAKAPYCSQECFKVGTSATRRARRCRLKPRTPAAPYRTHAYRPSGYPRTPHTPTAPASTAGGVARAQEVPQVGHRWLGVLHQAGARALGGDACIQLDRRPTALQNRSRADGGSLGAWEGRASTSPRPAAGGSGRHGVSRLNGRQPAAGNGNDCGGRGPFFSAA